MLLRTVEVERELFFGLATHDTLTGMYNGLALGPRRPDPRHARPAAASEWSRSRCSTSNWFKAVNDQHGHRVGDVVLQKVGEAIRGSVRSDDVAARIGGRSSWWSASPTDDPVDGVARAPARRGGSSRVRPARAGAHHSAGVAERVPGESYEAVLARADTALYRAKQAGRDRIVVAETAD